VNDPRILNAMTIDLEDWMQSTLGPDHPITSRVIYNLERFLRLLNRHHVRATFFALGKVCEKFPILLEMVSDAGHEIGTHGYGHEYVHSLTPDLFRRDIERSIEIIEKQTSHRPVGYRAPAFSITRESWWAGPILVECGLKYSSSLFPIKGRRYGVPDAPRWPHRWEDCDLMEFPLTTVTVLGKNLPMCGGGYFRLLPWPILSWAIGKVNREGHPAVVYMHPYEMDVYEVKELKRQGYPISMKTRFMQSLFRSRIQGRLDRMFRRYRFGPMAEVLGIE
jgi:polysaccharide deacetylase family protein (PEP-CTERM system associated)